MGQHTACVSGKPYIMKLMLVETLTYTVDHVKIIEDRKHVEKTVSGRIK